MVETSDHLPFLPLLVEYGIGKLGGADGGLKNTTTGRCWRWCEKPVYRWTIYRGWSWLWFHRRVPLHRYKLWWNLWTPPFPTSMRSGGGADTMQVVRVRVPYLEADGNGTVTIQSTGISANGGNVAASSVNGGGFADPSVCQVKVSPTTVPSVLKVLLHQQVVTVVVDG